MKEVWLTNNRRVDGAILIVAALVVFVLACLTFFASGETAIRRILPMLATVLALFWALYRFALFLTPRLAYRNSKLLVYLKGLFPVQVPIDCVEVFFMGQGESKLKLADGKPLENSTIVVRLAEAAEKWHRIEVKRRLGHWCEGYITIRGAWCEPINGDTIRRMNESLRQIKKKQSDLAKSGVE